MRNYDVRYRVMYLSERDVLYHENDDKNSYFLPFFVR